MVKMISGLDNEQIQYFLEEIHRVARLEGDLALVEADKLMWEILSSNKPMQGNTVVVDANPAISSSPVDHIEYVDSLAEEDQSETLRQLMVDLQSKLDKEADITPNDIIVLESRVSWLGQFWDKKQREKFAGSSAKLREDAEKVLADLHEALHTQRVIKANHEPIAGITSVQRIYREMNEAHSFFLKKKKLGTELLQQIRSAKERAAKFRAMKKLSEAEVVAGGGNQRKADKLRAEASIMLKQDWAVAFPNEDVPAILEV